MVLSFITRVLVGVSSMSRGFFFFAWIIEYGLNVQSVVHNSVSLDGLNWKVNQKAHFLKTFSKQV